MDDTGIVVTGPSIARFAARRLVFGLAVVAASGAGAGPSTGWAQDAGPEEDVDSEAERIITLQSLVASDVAWLDEVQRDQAQVEADYERVSNAFVEVDHEVAVATRQVETSTDGQGSDELERLIVRRKRLRDRFDTLIQRRRALASQLRTLQKKLELERHLLDVLKSGKPLSFVTERTEDKAEAAGSDPSPPSDPPKQTAPSPISMVPGLGPTVPSTRPPSEPQPEGVAVDSVVLRARQDLDDARAQLSRAETQVAVLNHALEVFAEDLESARELQAASKTEIERIRANLKELDEKTAAESEAPADDPRRKRLESIRNKLLAALEEEQESLVRQDERIRGSESLLDTVRKARERTAERVSKAREAVEAAQRWLTFSRSSFAPHRFVGWLTRVGSKILIIVAVMWILRRLADVFATRILTVIARRNRRGDPAARKERAETLSRVFRSTLTVIILVTGTLAILSQAGVDVTVLLGGAAVFGAALAFGSQSLIKDYFSGFMVLVENQYSVGNVIKIGNVSGIVEDITLRMTVLRDLEGIVHFVPHSQLTAVSNLTYGWSRALFDISVAYKEDVDRVMRELIDLGTALREDDSFGPMILSDPEMLGVDAFGDSAVVIKFFIKTRPLMQWNVKRELLRRIKNRFDEVGIEIPFPHRTLYYGNREATQHVEDGPS